jgi:hypothetical protein
MCNRKCGTSFCVTRPLKVPIASEYMSSALPTLIAIYKGFKLTIPSLLNRIWEVAPESNTKVSRVILYLSRKDASCLAFPALCSRLINSNTNHMMIFSFFPIFFGVTFIMTIVTLKLFLLRILRRRSIWGPLLIIVRTF